MKKVTLTIILSWLVVWLANCHPRRKRNEAIKTFHRTGEAIAVDDLIHKYEREHQKLYKKIEDDDILRWPGLDYKTISNYCRKYLHHAAPGRTTDGATGTRSWKTLQYVKLNTNVTSTVNTLQCRVMNKNFPLTYYLTKALEPNCVYALKSKGRGAVILTIINKYCDFEDKPLIQKCLKQKSVEIISKVHRKTGQPIAKDDYLLKYELEIQELLNREGCGGKSIGWPYATVHPNLNSYCYQYMRDLVPGRNRENVKGSQKADTVNFEKLSSNVFINVIAVKCQTAGASKLSYYITRAPETNCAYALLRRGFTIHDPLVITFKLCDFEERNNRQIISQNHNIHEKDVIPKIEVKEEIFKTTETLQLFQNINYTPMSQTDIMTS